MSKECKYMYNEDVHIDMNDIYADVEEEDGEVPEEEDDDDGSIEDDYNE